MHPPLLFQGLQARFLTELGASSSLGFGRKGRQGRSGEEEQERCKAVYREGYRQTTSVLQLR